MSARDQADPMRRFGAVLAAMQDQARIEGRARARAGFLMAASLQRRRPRPWGWRWTAGLAACAAVALGLWIAAPAPALTFVVGPDRAAGNEQSWIVAPPAEPLELAFSDGSSIALRPDARARVVDTQRQAPRLILESGAASIDVVAADRRWTFEAGPCRVDVEDAALELTWAVDPGACTIEVSRGSARVVVPDREGPTLLAPGDRLEWGRPTQAVEAPPAPAGAVAPAAVESPPRAEVEPAPRGPTLRGRRAVDREPRSTASVAADWRPLAARGDYRGAIAAAKAAGFSALCSTLDADDLLELADASRYAHERKLAIAALDAVRRRFAGSDAAAVAALDLGRLHADDCARAIPWFRRYVEERPSGPLVDVARKRLRECGDAGERSPR